MASPLTPRHHAETLTPADLGELAAIVDDVTTAGAASTPWDHRTGPIVLRPGVLPPLCALAVLLRQLAADGVTVEHIGTDAVTITPRSQQ